MLTNYLIFWSGFSGFIYLFLGSCLWKIFDILTHLFLQRRYIIKHMILFDHPFQRDIWWFRKAFIGWTSRFPTSISVSARSETTSESYDLGRHMEADFIVRLGLPSCRKRLSMEEAHGGLNCFLHFGLWKRSIAAGVCHWAPRWTSWA